MNRGEEIERIMCLIRESIGNALDAAYQEGQRQRAEDYTEEDNRSISPSFSTVSSNSFSSFVRSIAMSDQNVREAMIEMGEQADPVREALRRMLVEFGDEHYHTCPADNRSGPCGCFAGHLIAESVRRLKAED